RVLPYMRHRRWLGANRGELGLAASVDWRERSYLGGDGSLYCAVSRRARVDADSPALLFLYPAHPGAADPGLLVRDSVPERTEHARADQSRWRGLVGAYRRVYSGDVFGVGPAPEPPPIRFLGRQRLIAPTHAKPAHVGGLGCVTGNYLQRDSSVQRPPLRMTEKAASP